MICREACKLSNEVGKCGRHSEGITNGDFNSVKRHGAFACFDLNYFWKTTGDIHDPELQQNLWLR